MNLKNPDGIFQNIHLGINYQNIEESRHNRNFGSQFRNHRIENVGVFGADLDFQLVMKSHDIHFGADMQLNNLKSTANKENIVNGTIGKLDTRYPDGINKMNNFAVYISHTWNITKKLMLTNGIRVGYSSLHSTLIDTALLFHLPYTIIDQKTPVYSGSTGLIYSPSDDLKISLLLSTGFRVPNVDDMSKIFASSPGAVIVPNIHLKPELTFNYELGITKILTNKIRWENFIYYTRFSNAVVTDKAIFQGKDSIMYDGAMSRVFANQNKGKANLYGFSSNFISQLNDNFKISFVMNYTYGRIKTDTTDYPLDHIPPFMSRLACTYSNKNFSSDFFVNYNGWKRLKDYNLGGEDNEQYATADGMPAWLTANIHVSYRIHKLITLQAGADNIFNTQYRTFASGINAPGINIFAALRFQY
jgi:hemoglobin/transferrin/lactoferrin receptor protein